jgi:hypothetical protein
VSWDGYGKDLHTRRELRAISGKKLPTQETSQQEGDGTGEGCKARLPDSVPQLQIAIVNAGIRGGYFPCILLQDKPQ